MKKNDIIKLKITGISADGSGVGHDAGMAVFVPLSAVGDTVRVRVLKVLQHYAFGKIEELLSPSPDRIAPACPIFERCGGCAYHHITYQAELELKGRRVADALGRIGGLCAEVLPVLGSDRVEGYRNKAEYPVGTAKDGSVVSGFYANHSHVIVPCDRCLIQSDTADRIKKLIVQFLSEFRIPPYNEITGKGLVRHIFVRTGSTGEAMVVLVINGNSLPHSDELVTQLTGAVPGITSISLNLNKKATNVVMGDKMVPLFGSGILSDKLLGLTFSISARSFYQVNHAQCEKLYSIALEKAAVGPGDTCLDLYCGAGTITCLLAKRAKKVYGVEIVPEAVENAKANAARNGITNIEFLCACADVAAEKLRKEGVSIDVLTVDPPRKGLEPALIETISRIAPKRVVYVSCDPATLARDLRLLCEKRFEVSGPVQPVDMFPRTQHVECCCLLERIS